MRKFLKVFGLMFSGAFLLLVVLVAWAWYASQQVPAFYQQAMSVDPVKQKQANKEMLRRTTNLVNEVKLKGQWEAVFTADQINGWLAVDLVKNHPKAMPKEISDPRVAITPEAAKLACRYKDAKVETVFNLSVDIYLAEPNVLALRFKAARAGSLPLPMSKVLDIVTKGAEKADLRLRWETINGEPAAMITFALLRDDNTKKVLVEKVELRDGAIYLSGRTVPHDQTDQAPRTVNHFHFPARGMPNFAQTFGAAD